MLFDRECGHESVCEFRVLAILCIWIAVVCLVEPLEESSQNHSPRHRKAYRC